MKRIQRYFSLILFILTLFSCRNVPVAEEDLTRYVDPFIGTADHGHVYPGATVPFGMVQLSPDNGTQGWDWCSGYNWADSLIVGFSHTHLSGTGIGDLCDVLVMPALAPSDFTKAPSDPRQSDFAASFSHSNESASPGYYRVGLDNGISAELTATTRVGMHRYTFPAGAPPRLIVDLGYAINWDRPTDTRIARENDTLITGYRLSRGWATDQRLYFAMALSAAPTGLMLADSSALTGADSLRGRRVRAQLTFAAAGQPLLVKVGVSSAGIEGAKAALAEAPGWDFDRVRGEAVAAWNRELRKMEVVSEEEEQKTIFYTALYRTCLAPVTFSDARGEYKGPDGAIHRAAGYTRYDIFSLWDTFRAAHPLYTITQPDKVNDFIRSLLDHYEQTGLLPVWSLLGNETNTMTGYHAVPVVVDAYAKGFRDYDVDQAFGALITSAGQDIRGTDFYRQYGYIPHDKDGESVTKTLEYAFDDWCIAHMAGLLGKEEERQTFQRRAQSYRQLYDPSTGFMRARLADGSWKSPFDPKFSDHNAGVAEYTEGNAWQHSWFVPHDVSGLIALHGGGEGFVAKLDSLFEEDSEIRGENASADISGLIGQYAHGNEPSHHIAYLYTFAGASWKTQARVRQIMDTQYNATAAGLCGNEDCGQMSAWYVFSALGFYPVNPASGVYVVGSPRFAKARIEVGPGRYFTVTCRGASADHPYIQSAILNGRPLERGYLTHAELAAGGELVVEMGNTPNKSLWQGQEAAPPGSSGE